MRFYAEVMGFSQLQHFDDDQISTEYSALMSTVVWDGSKIVMPINEPADGLQEEPDPGVHRALRRSGRAAHRDAHRRHRHDGAGAPRSRRALHAGARRPTTSRPANGWRESTCRGTSIERLNILVDRDHDGHLLQIFTETITDRPAVFFEIIEREGAKGFGEGNFKALFEAIERDQARRGNL